MLVMILPYFGHILTIPSSYLGHFGHSHVDNDRFPLVLATLWRISRLRDLRGSLATFEWPTFSAWGLQETRTKLPPGSTVDHFGYFQINCDHFQSVFAILWRISCFPNLKRLFWTHRAAFFRRCEGGPFSGVPSGPVDHFGHFRSTMSVFRWFLLVFGGFQGSAS